jgi:hypothetical protein
MTFIPLRRTPSRTTIRPPTRSGGIPVDMAKLRENARVVRTMQGELVSLYRAQGGRFIGEKQERSRKDDAAVEGREAIDWGPDHKPPADDELRKISDAQASLLGTLTKAFLELTEELAGDIDQDITTWKPPPE